MGEEGGSSIWFNVGSSTAQVGLTPLQAFCGLDGLCTLDQAVSQVALSKCSLPCSCLFQDNNLSLIMQQKTCGVEKQTWHGHLAEGWGPAWLTQHYTAGHAPHPLGCSPKLSCPFVQSHRGLRHLGHLPAKEMFCSKPIIHLTCCHEALTVLCYHQQSPVLFGTSGDTLQVCKAGSGACVNHVFLPYCK